MIVRFGLRRFRFALILLYLSSAFACAQPDASPTEEIAPEVQALLDQWAQSEQPPDIEDDKEWVLAARPYHYSGRRPVA